MYSIDQVTLKTASDHKYFGTFICTIKVRATARICLCLRSATLFYWEVCEQEIWWTIPFL